MENTLLIESSPQIRSKDSTKKIMWNVSLALMPASVWGIIVFGFSSLLILCISIISAISFEWLIGRLLHKNTLFDGSAFLTGLLVGMNMPPAVPVYIPILASAFAIVIVKWTFGGLGSNWMNPALAGRVFVFFSWTSSMSSWTLPKFLPTVDSVSTASPLGAVKVALTDISAPVSSAVEILEQAGYSASNFSQNLSTWFSDTLSVSISAITLDSFFGIIPGCIGEVSALFLILGGIYLLAKKVITWHIPLAYIGSFTILTWIFGGLRFGQGLFQGSILFNLFTGGLMLGAFFMATDMVTTPTTTKGMLIFGFGAGFLTFLFRIYGSLPEGVSLAIILMNIFTPMIDRYVRPKKFGFVNNRGDA